MKKFLIIFIFIIGCSSNKSELTNNPYDIKFSDSLSFEEYKIKLNDYAQYSPYPNIEN